MTTAWTSVRLPDPRPAAVAMTAVLATWLAAWGIEAAAGLRMSVIVLAVVLAVSLGRVTAREGVVSLRAHGGRVLLRMVLLPVVALAATEVGRLLATHEWLGGLVFCVALAVPVWVRRFGRAWTMVGTLVTLPFISLLVVPVPIDAGTAHTLWPALFAVLAFAIVTLVYAVAGRAGLLGEPAPAAVTPASPASSRRLPASTRMALQLLVGLLASYALGQWLFPEHWPWVVLSCFVVSSGNRGRGDVLHKGVLRLAGALAGTASATLLTGSFPAGDRLAVVLLFVVMALAVWLRELSYAWWAAGVTAMLALLHGYVGVGGVGELGDRLLGVLLGSAIAVAVAWWLLPVRSRDVFRRRLGEALRAFRDDDLDHFRGAVAMLEQVQPAHRMHRRALRALRRRHDDDHPATLVERLVAIRDDWSASGRRDREMGEEIRSMAAVVRNLGQK
jgi:hypothetical protein